MRSKLGGAIAAALRCASSVSDARRCVVMDPATCSSCGSDRQSFSCSWQHLLLMKKIAKLRLRPVQQAEDRPARPRCQHCDLLGGVSLHHGQKQRFAFFRSQRTDRATELPVLQNVGRIPIQIPVFAFAPLPLVIERDKKDLAISPIAIDESVPNRRKDISRLPRSARCQYRHTHVLKQIRRFDGIASKRECVAVAALEQRVDAIGYVMLSVGRVEGPHPITNNEREWRLIACQPSAHSAPAARIADAGNVTSQASTISPTIFHCTSRREMPTPMIAPEDTWVVETGSANRDAAPTRMEVTRLAANPLEGEIRVTFSASVRVTRNPATMLPTPIASATSAYSGSWPTPSVRAAATPSARIFGVSFKPRKKLVAPEEIQWSESIALTRATAVLHD